jgi:hypothetical protein
MAKRINLVVEQGATFSQDFQLSDINNDILQVTAANGSPLFTGSSQMRKSYQSSNSIAFNVALSNGMMTLSLTSNVTAIIVPGRYVFDVELTSNNANGAVNRIVEGIITIKPEVTKT